MVKKIMKKIFNDKGKDNDFIYITTFSGETCMLIKDNLDNGFSEVLIKDNFNRK